MKAFIADIIPRIQRFSKRIEDETLLTNHHWVSLNDIVDSKKVFIFRANKSLLVSDNGNVSKGNWEYLGNNSILIETSDNSTLYKQGFIDEHVMALKIDGINGHYFFINETKYGKEINSIADVNSFLESKYVNTDNKTTYSIDENGIPEHDETAQYSYDLVFGQHDKIELKFKDGISGEIYFGHKTKKYFFVHFTWGKKYFDSKLDCIKEFYRHKKFNE